VNPNDIMTNLGAIIGVVCGCGIGALAIGISGFLIFRLIRGQAQTRTLLQTGVPAPAVIVSVQDTGVLINDQPQARVTLQVTPTDRPPFQATITQVFSLFEVGSVVPGATVQVRFDTNDVSKIAIESFGARNAGGTGGVENPQLQAAMMAQDQYYAQLRITGTEAKAKILTATNLNMRNDNVAWVFRLTFDVTTPTGEHFNSETQAAIVDASQPKYQPGKEVIVRYDPANKAQVALVRAVEG
jgi:hypothetical protein